MTDLVRTGLLGPDSEVLARILGAAERCFCGSGYAATSMREIAEVAHVSKSLLHYHFQSKEHLFLEVLVSIYNRLAARVVESVPASGSPAERALFAVDALFDALGSVPDLHVQARVWARSLTDESLEAHAVKMREHLRTELIRSIRQILGPAEASLPVGIDVIADLLWATVSGLGLEASDPGNRVRVDNAFQALRAVVAASLNLPFGQARRRPASPAKGKRATRCRRRTT